MRRRLIGLDTQSSTALFDGEFSTPLQSRQVKNGSYVDVLGICGERGYENNSTQMPVRIKTIISAALIAFAAQNHSLYDAAGGCQVCSWPVRAPSCCVVES